MMEPGYHIPRNGRDRELGSERKLGARETEKESEREQDFLFLSLLFLFLSLIFLFLGLIHYSFWVYFRLFLRRIWDSGNGSDSENDDQNVDELW